MRITISVCSDDPLSGAGLGALLAAQEDFEVIGQSSSAGETVQKMRDTRPDVAVVSLSEIDIAAHREMATAAKVVTLADIGVELSPSDVLTLNARAVLTPSVTPGELIQTIRVVAAGDAVLIPLTVSRHIDSVMQNSSASRVGASITQLTERETDVLGLLARGLSNSEVADRLFISGSTVRSHVHHILQKLSVRSRAQAVAAAYELGLSSLAMEMR
ncbi:response regulator transcription factor [Streptacidiphilus jiangxiensis]|uniref:DNA-binding response regulator, NarL/FixJ family, contains REC and HTH domains n=1 Tax=Streptacidiphilus jiangxiensis TaxID=235985 RepID=A0A1H7KS01_STRJI|nr:response regulator transcription factor [Streptacidiphilus jiangxiensis]SEK89528.1 DNA-binding response regulator, NarL/FixJ family, contains REC and HTH domains [Streptacidiphilus jiangxiensis]